MLGPDDRQRPDRLTAVVVRYEDWQATPIDTEMPQDSPSNPLTDES